MEQADGTVTHVTGWSLVPLRLTFVGGSGGDIAVASGFCWKHEEQMYIVSAWHCLSGRNAVTGQAMNTETGELPQKVRTRIPGVVGDESAGTVGDWIEKEFDLCDADGQARWFEHAAHGRKVDVGMLPVEISGDLNPRTPVAKESTALKRLAPSLDVFLVGYPLRLTVTGDIAIWKRATIASEPEVNPDDLPLLYIDCSAVHGMSGAPVLWRGPDIAVGSGRPETHFIGTYSGRKRGTRVPDPSDGDEELDAELGMVWKREVLNEISAAGQYCTEPQC